eukprot:TRINITY_DN64999_c0_g1_i1.p1 TRINITY_DN64999_c0_g1~~TRINITY_DN64999_c0_g1_i1.p1  ORF type:complete len:316 (+),score=58.70 TRINITY_DN64999_c0_g1_i1:136-1083(+)
MPRKGGRPKRPRKGGGGLQGMMAGQFNKMAATVATMPKIPKGVDKDELFDAVKKYVLKEDSSCVKGPPETNDQNLPGLRYGASLEMRPKLLVAPCPCPGGVFNKAWKDASGELQPGGLWATWPSPKFEDASKAQQELEANSFPSKETPSNFGLIGGALGGMAKDLLGETYHPGSEPYSADFGCAKGMTKGLGPLGDVDPGKRWWNAPDHVILPLETPCPCALGMYTGLQDGVQKNIGKALTPASGAKGDDSWGNGDLLAPPKVAKWQTLTGDLRLGSMGSLAVLLLAMLNGISSSEESCSQRRARQLKAAAANFL